MAPLDQFVKSAWMLGATAVVVAAWTAVVKMTDLAPKLPEYQDNLQAKLHSVNVVTTLAEAQEQVRLLIELLLVPAEKQV